MRLFVGLSCPDMISDALAALSGGLPGARWIAPENHHLTLRFIGDVDGAMADDIHRALSEITTPAFDLTLKGVGQFSSARRARAVWADVNGRDAVAHLQAKVESVLSRIGLEAEHRKFKPHVTVARLKNTAQGRVADWLLSHADFVAGPFCVDDFILYRSHLSKDGAHYEAVARYPLQPQ